MIIISFVVRKKQSIYIYKNFNYLISSFMINVRNASTSFRQWSSEEVTPLKNRHRCRMHETSRARNIARSASWVTVSSRDVSRNMRALEESASERPSFLVSLKPVLHDSPQRIHREFPSKVYSKKHYFMQKNSFSLITIVSHKLYN